MLGTNNFQILFRKYRLKAEFSTLSQLGFALAEKGLIYEDSIFSHWQKGTRIPQSRNVLLKLLEIFIERKAVTSIDQANEFLSSSGQGYLSEEELRKVALKPESVIFQVPNEIVNFSGRKDIITRLAYQENIIGKVILIHGVAGVGKTALAIKLGHLLKDQFKDGVLWYKVERDNIMDILLSIAHTLGEDISNISDKQVRATVVRSLLISKNALLFLDSGELNDDIHLLIPNSQFCTTIITSQKSYLKIPIQYIDIKLEPFTDKEALVFFIEILKDKYTHSDTDAILKLGKRVGNLPLTLHILARELLHSKITITRLQTLLNQENNVFGDLYYENKNLYATIAVSYKKLDIRMKSILASASIFQGKDFSAKSTAYINGFSTVETTKMLQNLVDLSLIEHSTKNRYRIHPAIREFVRDKLDYPRSSNLIFIAILIFTFFTVWWVYLQLFVDKNNPQYLIFIAIYCVLSLYGGVCGIITSLNWGGIKTLMGRAIAMFSFGLFMQLFGQLAYAYYSNFKHIPVPYPSIGDIGYFATIPFYTYGAFLLAESSGIKINIKSFQKKIAALVIPLLMLVIAYMLFLQDYKFDWSNPIKIFLDFVYPLGDAIYISIAIITFIFSRTILDGIMQSKAFLVLIALFVQFFADYVFLYQVRSNSYYGGNIVDYLYLVAYFVMTLALLNLRSLQVKIKNM